LPTALQPNRVPYKVRRVPVKSTKVDISSAGYPLESIDSLKSPHEDSTTYAESFWCFPNVPTGTFSTKYRPKQLYIQLQIASMFHLEHIATMFQLEHSANPPGLQVLGRRS
jgi:hypothetical protein